MLIVTLSDFMRIALLRKIQPNIDALKSERRKRKIRLDKLLQSSIILYNLAVEEKDNPTERPSLVEHRW